MLYSHEDILSKDIILKIPINSGYKLFYVKSGLVVNCGNNKDLNDFLADSKDKKTEFYDEKSRMDFRDILLSELNTLSEECIIYV